MPFLRNEQQVYSRNQGLAYYAVFNVSNQVIYEAWAQPGSALTSAVWQVCKHTYTSDNLTRTEWSDGSDDFKSIASNYLTLSYS